MNAMNVPDTRESEMWLENASELRASLSLVRMYRNTDVLIKMVHDQIISELTDAEAINLFDDLLMFLWLKNMTHAIRIPAQNSILVPPLRIDKAWKTFFSFGEAYRIFCEKHLGRYIDRNLEDNGENAADSLLRMEISRCNIRNMFVDTMGLTLSPNWEYTAIIGTAIEMPFREICPKE